MASSSTWAQDVITCDLCDSPTKKFCNNCQVSLCGGCINKHVENLTTLAHDIVPFKRRKMKLVFTECEHHQDERCEAYCKQCDVPVCLKCIIGTHRGHLAVEMAEIVNAKKGEIEKETKELETVLIPTFQQKDEITGKKISKLEVRFADLEKESERCRAFWHQEVDDIFDTLSSLIKSLKDDHLTSIKTQQAKIKKSIPLMMESVQQNRKILNSNKVSEVTSYRSTLKKYRTIPVEIDLVVPSLKTKKNYGKELSIEFGEYKATLKQSTIPSLADEAAKLTVSGQLLDEPRLIARFETGIKPLWRMACIGTVKVWLSCEDEIIRLFDRSTSTTIDTINTTCSDWPYDMVALNEEELVYSDVDNRTVNYVQNGRTRTLITTPQGWQPRGLCITRSGHFLICMRSSDFNQHKVVRYEGQKILQVIDKDEYGNSIFSGGQFGMFVEENKNGDILVSDLQAQAVIGLEWTGRVQFRYMGTTKGEIFDPRKIVTDSESRILVANTRGFSIHILNHCGQFLTQIHNCNVPVGISLDSQGKLWVGSFHTGEVMVFKYSA